MTSGTNGTVTSPTQEVLRYAAGVRAELADLTPAQRDDLLEDLEDHLSEVAAELNEPLESRLGPPEVYAAELRASAGLAPASARTSRRSHWNADWVRALRGFLVELQPAWWVLRGLVAALVLGAIVGPLAAVVFAIPAVILSVLLGRRTRGRRGPWILAFAANTVAVIAGLVLIPALGTPITNIFPYDAQGQPLSGVRLYDQDGRPITNVSNFTADGVEVDRSYPVEPNGLRVRNAYPQDVRLLGEFSGPPMPTPTVSPGG
jgi:uncharacterized membrane protein